ncbi:MAG: type II 3-dehydroquinate dehydratase [Rickettsiales bacterium]
MADSVRLLILNGPNLNMLGVREPEIYGYQTLDDIRAMCEAHAASAGAEIDFRQSNSESELVGWIQEARETADAIVINPAAFTHTSVAIMDALLVFGKPVVEIHISNIFQREAFRHHSYISAAAQGIISGFGSHGYVLAMDAACRMTDPAEGA